jgi:hypothetical protein
MFYVIKYLFPCMLSLVSDVEEAPMQHFYPVDSSIPRRVPEFYFNLSVIYFVLVTIGVVFCYPYDKNDPYFKSFTGEEKSTGDGVANEDEIEESHSLIKPKLSPTVSAARKTFHLDSEIDSKEGMISPPEIDRKPSSSHQQALVLDLNPKDLVFEPMCYIFEMCMVFTNVGGE